MIPRIHTRINPARMSLACLVATVALVGCTTTSTETTSTDDQAVVDNDPASRPGNPAVYARIESSTDCVGLQREFDVAMSNVESRDPGDELRAVSLSYGEAANNRMREIGCFG